jgi:U1 small nuclear ribonucleoprotein
MTDRLPPNLLALFAPRPPLRWVPPSDHAPEQRKTAAVSGVAQFLPALAEYEREHEYHPTESWLEARDRKKREKLQQVEEAVTEGPKNCVYFFSGGFGLGWLIVVLMRFCLRRLSP